VRSAIKHYPERAVDSDLLSPKRLAIRDEGLKLLRALARAE
jgi:hypothetical protein